MFSSNCMGNWRERGVGTKYRRLQKRLVKLLETGELENKRALMRKRVYDIVYQTVSAFCDLMR